MFDPFAVVAEALAGAREAWETSQASGPAADGASGAELIRLHEAVAHLRRSVDAAHTRVAAEVARASRPELGNAGLARGQGYRTPAALIAASTGSSVGEASRLVLVGEATAARMTLTGDEAPSRHPKIARALAEGRISVSAAAAIVALLDRVVMRAGRDATAEAESTLVAKAAGLTLDQLGRVLQRAEAWLDPDGVEPREADLRSGRALHFHEDRTGVVHVTGRLDPETAAPFVTAVQAMVAVELRHREENTHRGGRADGSAADDRRSIPQIQADALATLCRHALGCDARDVPTAGATVVVRIGLEQLEAGVGHGEIDGLAQPVSVTTVRRMAAAGPVIPCVLGGEGEILDFGRARRLFSPTQKLALVERDGGCAMCGLPPGMTQVHHIRWWNRDAGPTDLDNGILLCVRCHHRIHDDGWEIRIDGSGARAEVWFLPPRHIDPARAPRRGGRVRYDYLAA